MSLFSRLRGALLHRSIFTSLPKPGGGELGKFYCVPASKAMGKSYVDNEIHKFIASAKAVKWMFFKKARRPFLNYYNAAWEDAWRLNIPLWIDVWRHNFRGPSSRYDPKPEDKLPDSIDWRRRGVVTAVKKQDCYTCWAFSTAAVVEGIHKITTGNLVAVSAQQLIDYDRKSYGLLGGFFAFDFIVKNGGIETDANYKKCHKENRTVVSIDGYEFVKPGNEAALKKAVANQPIGVYVDSNEKGFKKYQRGIFRGRRRLFSGKCRLRLDHAMTVVGYGTEDGKDYWLLKNSWGKCWGEKGFMKIERNVPAKEGAFGIAVRPSYPTVG